MITITLSTKKQAFQYAERLGMEYDVIQGESPSDGHIIVYDDAGFPSHKIQYFNPSMKKIVGSHCGFEIYIPRLDKFVQYKSFVELIEEYDETEFHIPYSYSNVTFSDGSQCVIREIIDNLYMSSELINFVSHNG